MRAIVAVTALALGIGCAGTAPPAAGFESLGAGRIRHLESGIVLVRIAPGTFRMGSPDGEPRRDRDEVLHEVRIEAPYYLGEAEVTVAEWRRVMGPDGPELGGAPDDPIQSVTWHRADEFARTLAASTPGFRLPTEAEWEYACRAGTTTPFSFGQDVDPSLVHYDASAPYRDGARGARPRGPVATRSLPANPWGLYEMHGNLWEWTEDLYVYDRTAGPATSTSPGAPRVMRGGAFTRGAYAARCAHRDGYPPATPGEKYGFRIAWSPGS